MVKRKQRENTAPLKELPPLEVILHQVDVVNYQEDPALVAGIKEDVACTYKILQEVRKGGSLTDITQQYGLSARTTVPWRDGVVPRNIKPYLSTGLPETREETQAFLYILGGVSYKHSATMYDEPYVTRANKNSRKRLRDNIQLLTRHKTRAQGVITKIPRTLTRTLAYAFDHFDEFVTNDEERRWFLQGMFDAINIDVGKARQRPQLEMQLPTPEDKRYIKSFFELGVYPHLTSCGEQFLLVPFDLEQCLRQGLILDQDIHKNFCEEITAKKKRVHSIEQYYRALRRAEQKDQTYAAIGREVGVTRANVRTWVVDGRMPQVVMRYRVLADLLEVPDVYRASEPVFRHGKLFVAAGDFVYIVPPEVQAQYRTEYDTPIDKEAMRHIQDLVRNRVEGRGDAKGPEDVTLEIEGYTVTSLLIKEGSQGSRRAKDADTTGVRKSGATLWSGWDEQALC